MLKKFDRFFETRKSVAALFLRLGFGFHLMFFTADNVFSYSRMLEFEKFLAVNGFPFPLFCAFLSVYAQFICGFLWILGLFVRPAAAIVIVNFIVAILMVHLGQDYEGISRPLLMVWPAISLMFSGAGKYSIDNLFLRKIEKERVLA
jgi:putative oxidoreductase